MVAHSTRVKQWSSPNWAVFLPAKKNPIGKRHQTSAARRPREMDCSTYIYISPQCVLFLELCNNNNNSRRASPRGTERRGVLWLHLFVLIGLQVFFPVYEAYGSNHIAFQCTPHPHQRIIAERKGGGSRPRPPHPQPTPNLTLHPEQRLVRPNPSVQVCWVAMTQHNHRVSPGSTSMFSLRRVSRQQHVVPDISSFFRSLLSFHCRASPSLVRHF